ncbi:hypothetical protein [Actinokineospora iranica]|uniref:Uncharacterized protein n=1 Tax=Actinokineospora iranica TaxID=1271860 RepID=A0A1G6MUS2_9PSEU|nr:hypothetical protein [Actinokineospora iranica]SDC59300.1 hypothetical protein SAMN05216174_10340 [Actinokineospora iranica]
MVSEFERTKDTIQEMTETAATHVGRIAQIITSAVRDVAREIGDWATDTIEMREAAQRAAADHKPARPVIVDEEP